MQGMGTSSKRRPAINAVFVNAFLHATIDVLKTMAEIDIVPGKPFIKRKANSIGDVSGIIGMAGQGGLQGAFAISFKTSTVLAVVNSMLCESYTAINHDVVDCVGELTNVISGAARATLSDLGREYGMATPTVINARDHSIDQVTKEAVVVMPFKTEAGTLLVELTLFQR